MRKSEVARIRVVKPEIRILGIDDGVFTPHTRGLVDVIGVVFRGGYWLNGVMRTQVEIDGMDATERIASMIVASPHYDQLRIVMLNGVTMAGFNVVDIEKLHEDVKLPVIAVTRDKPNFNDIRKALQNLPQSEKRWEAIEKAGKIMRVCTRTGEEPVFAHVAGISEEDAKRILKSTSTRSNIPEALRVAHLVASGLGRLMENGNQ
ncbi:MAG: DUF99 family protein [Candidatus Bathyarchaeota archaeon]|jgi:hypothetical protein